MSNICFVHINVFVKFDEIPSMILQDIKETKRYGLRDGQRENSIPFHKHSLWGVGGYKNKGADQLCYHAS